MKIKFNPQLSTYLKTFSALVVLSGCTKTIGIENQSIRDRVCACSAGFSDDIDASLQLAYDKTALKGGSILDFKNESQSIIFAEIPSQDKLKAYEDYINCIEKNWNSDSVLYPKKYISKSHQNKNQNVMPNKNLLLKGNK